MLPRKQEDITTIDLTYGHSLIISPDGEILKEKEKGEGFIIARIDENLPKKLRDKIPSLKSN